MVYSITFYCEVNETDLKTFKQISDFIYKKKKKKSMLFSSGIIHMKLFIL